MLIKCSNCDGKMEYKLNSEYSNNCNIRDKLICDTCNNEYYIFIKIRLHKSKTPAPYAKAAKKPAEKAVRKNIRKRM